MRNDSLRQGAGRHRDRDDGLHVRNTDLTTSYTIDQLTIRNLFGDVVHDSGPAIGVPHPLNTDIVPPLNITVVPPGATYYLLTNHLWGNNPVPGPAGGPQGNAMTAVVEFSANGNGNPSALLVSATRRERERFALARYLPDGTLDRAFGDDGRVVAGPAGRGALAVVVQPGRIVAAGGARTETADLFALVRLLPDGRPDVTFGTNGTVTTDFHGGH